MKAGIQGLQRPVKTVIDGAEGASADLLSAVDQALSGLAEAERGADYVTGMLSDLAREIREECDPAHLGYMNPDGVLHEDIQQHQEAVRANHERLVRKWQSLSPRSEEKAEAVAASCNRTVIAHERLYDALEALRIAVLEHDAEVDKREGAVSGPHDNVDDLLAALNAEE